MRIVSLRLHSNSVVCIESEVVIWFLKQKPYTWYRGDVSLPWLAFPTLQTCQKTIFYTMLNAKTKNGSTVLWQLLHLECVLSNTI